MGFSWSNSYGGSVNQVIPTFIEHEKDRKVLNLKKHLRHLTSIGKK